MSSLWEIVTVFCLLATADWLAELTSRTGAVPKVQASYPPEDLGCVSKCPPLVSPANGQWFPTNCMDSTQKPCTVCTLLCNSNYTSYKNEKAFCFCQGNWNNPLPKCLKTCPAPLPVDGRGTFLPTRLCSKQVPQGRGCRLACKNGTKPYLDGTRSRKIKCGANGIWSRFPKCVGCPPLSVSANVEGGLEPCMRFVPRVCTTKWSSPGRKCTLKTCPNCTVSIFSKTTCQTDGQWTVSLFRARCNSDGPSPRKICKCTKTLCWPILKYGGKGCPPLSVGANVEGGQEPCVRFVPRACTKKPRPAGKKCVLKTCSRCNVTGRAKTACHGGQWTVSKFRTTCKHKN